MGCGVLKFSDWFCVVCGFGVLCLDSGVVLFWGVKYLFNRCCVFLFGGWLC